MPGRRRNGKNASPADGAAAGPAPALDVAAWARGVLSQAANELTEEERMLLEGQVKSFGRVEASPAPLPPDPTAPTVVRDRKALGQLAARLAGLPEIVIDLETSDLDPFTGEIVGVGISAADTNYYLPTGHRFEDGKLRPDQLPVSVVARQLHLEQLSLVAHNAKYEFRWLRRHAGVTCRFVWDVMLAARLLAAHLPADLKDLAMRELDVPDWSLGKEEIKKVQLLPVERVARYCAKDCYYTLELYRRQRACLG